MQNIFLICIILLLILLGFLVTFVASLIVLIIFYLPNVETLPRNQYILLKNSNPQIYTISNVYFYLLNIANSVVN